MQPSRFALTCSRTSITLIARSVGSARNNSRPLLEDSARLRDSKELLQPSDAPETAVGGCFGSKVGQVSRGGSGE